MWRWTAIIAAFFAYVAARFMMIGVVLGTTATDNLVVEIVPLIFALAVVAMVIFAVK